MFQMEFHYPLFDPQVNIKEDINLLTDMRFSISLIFFWEKKK